MPVLWQCYDRIIGWQPVPAWEHPALFIRGERSPYLADEYRDALLAQFPKPVRMWSTVPVTGSMPRNLMLFCAQYAVFCAVKQLYPEMAKSLSS